MQFTDFNFIVLPLTVKICKINAIWYFSSLNENVAKVMSDDTFPAMACSCMFISISYIRS